MLQRIFGFDPEKHSIKTEIVAGVTTFLTMAYILAVNPSIFAPLAEQGMPTDSVFTTTALAAIVGTLIMAVYAKKPFALAPGMGLNAFFVFTVCLTMGYSWQFALTAILLEGIIFIILTVTNVWQAIVDAIPASLKYAIGAGIGLFIAFIGLQDASIIIGDPGTRVTLSEAKNGPILLFIIGMTITSILVVMKVKGGILFGMLATTVIGIFFGETHIDHVVSMPASIAPIFLAIPPAATGVVLVIVGVIMMSPIAKIDRNDYRESIPAFLTSVLMPLTYSISHGIMIGTISYVIINACTGKMNKTNTVLWILAILFVLRYIFL